MKFCKIIATLLITVSTVTAQQKRDFFTMTRGDSTVIFITLAPSASESINVYRKEKSAGDQAYTLLNSIPIRQITDTEEALNIIEKDYEYLARQAGLTEPMAILRKIRENNFLAGIISLLTPSAAHITGRYFTDKSALSGKVYSYKLEVLDAAGNRKEILEKTVLIKEVLPAAVKTLKADAGDGSVKLKWEYPKWQRNYDDLTVRFNIYRSEGKKPFEKLNDKILLRNDNAPNELTDMWLKNGTEYSYYLTAVDPMGRESKPSLTVKVLPKDVSAPEIPANLTSDAAESTIQLCWDISLERDAMGYNIFRSTGLDKEAVKINKKYIPVEKNCYTDTTVSNGIQYFYTVTSIDSSGNESKHSNPLSVIAEDKTSPQAPGEIKYSIEKRFVKLRWQPSISKDAVGYYIYRGEDITARICSSPIKSTAWTDSGLTGRGLYPGIKYKYEITTIDKAGNESRKTELFISIPDDEAPAPPMNFTARNTDGTTVGISSGTSSSSDVKTYRIYKQLKSKKIIAAEFSKAPFRFQDTAVSKGEHIYYYASAIDSAGNESKPSQGDSVFVRDLLPPPAVHNVSAKQDAKGVTITWERVIDFDLAGYIIYRSEIPNGGYTRLTSIPVKQTSFSDKTGTKAYYYKVKSIDTSGNESTQDEYAEVH